MLPTVPDRRKLKLPEMTFRDLLQRTAEIYRANFRLFIVPVIVIMIPLTVVSRLVENAFAMQMKVTSDELNSQLVAQAVNSQQPLQLLSGLAGVVIAYLVISLGIALLQEISLNSLLTHMTSEQFLGRPPAFGTSVRAVLDRVRPLIGGILITDLMIVGLLLILSAILFACGLGIGLFLYVSIALTAMLSSVFILERTGVQLGVSRAWHIAKRHFWWIAGIGLIITIINIVYTALLTRFHLPEIILQPIEFAALILLTPVAPIANTLIYYDTRTRYEDLEGALNASENPAPTPADVLSPRPTGGVFAGRDVTNIALVTAGTIVLILIAVAINASNVAAARGL